MAKKLRAAEREVAREQQQWLHETLNEIAGAGPRIGDAEDLPTAVGPGDCGQPQADRIQLEVPS